MFLLIDNYDSFTDNLVQYLGELGADVHVHRNDALTLEQIAAWERRRNAEKARITWLFTVDRAREKLGRVHRQPGRRAVKAAA